MDWKKLKDGKCPKCSSKLNMGLLDIIYTCKKCDFRISQEKFMQIAYKKVFVSKDAELDNLSELNNLGRELVTEDFSDSPYK